MWVLLESYPARLLLAFILAINLEQLHSMATAAFTLRRWCLAFFILPAMFATSSFASSHSAAQSSVQAVQPTADLSRRNERRKKKSLGGEEEVVG